MKTSFIVAALSLVSTVVWAVPAAPVDVILSQSDGSEFVARQWGDEWLHGWETAEGYTIVFDEEHRNWVYADLGPDGKLMPSQRVVGWDPVPLWLDRHLRPQGEARTCVAERRQTVSEKQRVVPPTGTGQIPFLMINFNNTSTTYTSAQFNTHLLGSSGTTMRTYYEEVSYGAFSVAGTVVSWSTAAYTHDYYGQNTGGGGSDAYPATLVIEAVNAADATVNFANYDTDGDCYVDVVAVIHQGSAEEQGGYGVATDIWSHSWDLFSASYFGDGSGPVTTNDACPSGGNMIVYDYIIQPELQWGGNMSEIGVYCHEYGHALGLPDFYDTDYSSEGLGDWALMAGGSWDYVTRSGDTPAHMTAWSKYALGWVTPTQVTGTLTNETIQCAANAADVYQILDGSPSSSSAEYFLVENRYKTGFDAGLPGSGLAILHVDESVSGNDNECSPPSTCSSTHYQVSLEQADGSWDLEKDVNSGDIGDLFRPAISVNFTDSTTPNSKLYGGVVSGVSVTSVSVIGATMTATLTGPGGSSSIFSDGFESGNTSAWSVIVP